MKIRPVDTEIALLIVKTIKKKNKLRKVKYIVLSASLPSGLNKRCNKHQLWYLFYFILFHVCGRLKLVVYYASGTATTVHFVAS